MHGVSVIRPQTESSIIQQNQFDGRVDGSDETVVHCHILLRDRLGHNNLPLTWL
jgi:hypothetical protein